MLGWIQPGNHLVKPLGFIGGVAVGASQANSENMKIADLGLGKIPVWQWPPETQLLMFIQVFRHVYYITLAIALPLALRVRRTSKEIPHKKSQPPGRLPQLQFSLSKGWFCPAKSISKNISGRMSIPWLIFILILLPCFRNSVLAVCEWLVSLWNINLKIQHLISDLFARTSHKVPFPLWPYTTCKGSYLNTLKGLAW